MHITILTTEGKSPNAASSPPNNLLDPSNLKYKCKHKGVPKKCKFSGTPYLAQFLTKRAGLGLFLKGKLYLLIILNKIFKT